MPAAQIVKVIEYWKDGVIINQPVVINNDLLTIGCGIFRDDVVAGGTIGNFTAGSFDTTFDSYASREIEAQAIGQDEFNTLCTHQNDYSLCDVEFTFRTVSQYRTENFILFESRWQQIARIGGITTNTWTELPVNGTYPYPGKEIILGTTLRTMDLTLYDVNTGTAVNRGPDYEVPQFDTPQSLVLNGNYTVII